MTGVYLIKTKDARASSASSASPARAGADDGACSPRNSKAAGVSGGTSICIRLAHSDASDGTRGCERPLLK